MSNQQIASEHRWRTLGRKFTGLVLLWFYNAFNIAKLAILRVSANPNAKTLALRGFLAIAVVGFFGNAIYDWKKREQLRAAAEFQCWVEENIPDPDDRTVFMGCRQWFLNERAAGRTDSLQSPSWRTKNGRVWESAVKTHKTPQAALRALVGNYPEQLDSYLWLVEPQKKASEPIVDGGNPYAPVSADQIKQLAGDDAVEAYIQKYSPIAQAEMKKFGIPASISLAQGIVESRSGTSRLARNNNNHFGMKCFSRRCPKGHCTNATDDHHKDFFRKYQSSWESWRAHSKLLATGHYAKLKRYGSDYRQWAYGIKACGYATDGPYAEKLIGTIERYGLHRFDR